MKARPPKSAQSLLLQTPIRTALLIGLEKPAETGLAMREHDLFSVRREDLPLTVRLVGYQGKEGIWVVAVAFRIAGRAAREGVTHVNPRQENEYRLLQRLATQERFPFLFLTPSLKVAVEQVAPWSVHQRQEVRLLLAQIDHSLRGERLRGNSDPDFEAAKQEFQRLYSVSTLLAASTTSEKRVTSSFRGVVLD